MQCQRDNAVTTVREFNFRSKNFLIDVCPKCLGIWFERTELERLARLYEVMEKEDFFDLWKEYDGAFQHRVQYPEAYEEPAMMCPNGHGLLERNPYASDREMIIDRCRVCEGVWFDGWEVVRLLSVVAPYLSQDALVLAVAEYGTEKQKEEKERQEFLSLVNGVGSPVGFIVLLAYLMRPLIMNLLETVGTNDNTK